MSDEPVRWLESDDAPAPLAALLREAKSVPPMPDAVRDAVRASLREPGAAPTPGETAPAGAAAATASKITPLLAVTGAIAAVALGVLALVPPRRDLGPPSQPSAVAPAPSEEEEGEAGEVVAPAPTPAPERDESLDGAADAAPERHTVRPQSGAVDALAEEHALVQRARASLAHDPESSLLAAADHERRFADGQLAAEREFVRIKALVALGRRDEAAARGKRFLARFAASPYADRVRSLTRDGGAL